MCLSFQLLDCTGDLFEQQRTMHLFLASLQYRLNAAPQGLMDAHLLHPTHHTLYAAHMSTLRMLTGQQISDVNVYLQRCCQSCAWLSVP